MQAPLPKMEDIDRIRIQLLKIHRSSLQFQKEIYEKVEGVRLTPQETLNLTLQDAHFAWLKNISNLIINFDEAFAENKKSKQSQEALDELCRDFLLNITALFFDESSKSDFSNQLQVAKSRNSQLSGEIAELKKYLSVF